MNKKKNSDKNKKPIQMAIDGMTILPDEYSKYKNMGFSDSMIQGMQDGSNSNSNNGFSPYNPLEMNNTIVSRPHNRPLASLTGNQSSSYPIGNMNTPDQLQQLPMPSMNQEDQNTNDDQNENSSTPNKKKKKTFGFTTPGTGDLITAGLSMAANLLPEHQQSNMYHKKNYGGYNENAYGTGSQAIYADGGSLYPGEVEVKKRTEGGFHVTEEIPLSMRNKIPIQSSIPIQQPIQNYQQAYPAPIPKKSISYNKLALGSKDGRPVYEPVPSGGWNNHDWQRAMQDGTIPDNFDGLQVLKGDTWNENWNHPQYSDSSQWSASYGQTPPRTLIDITNNMGANSPKAFNPYKFANGGMIDGNGLQVEDDKYTHLSPHTIMINGDLHEDGGTQVQYGNNLIEAEKGEPLSIGQDGNAIIWGNMKVPGTKKKFKQVGEMIGKQEDKNTKLKDFSNTLLKNSNPLDYTGSLSFNSGKVIEDAANQKSKALMTTKEHLASTQEQLLQLAESKGEDAQDMSKKMKNGGKIEKAGDGKKVGKWRYNNTNLDGEDPKIIEFVKMLEEKGYSGESNSKSGVSNRMTQSGHPSRHMKGQALDMFFDNNKDIYKKVLQDPDLAGYLVNNGLTVLNEYDPNVAKYTGATAGHLHIGRDAGTGLAEQFRKDARKTYPNWDWSTGANNPTVPLGKIDKAQMMAAYQVIGDAQDMTPYKEDFSLTPLSTAQRPNTLPTSVDTPDQLQSIPVANNNTDNSVEKKNKTSLADRNKPKLSNFIGEIGALFEQPDPVKAQHFKPTLYDPYQVSYQDKLNENQSTFNSVESQLGNNAEALSVLAGQKYQQDNSILSDQFRTNQGIANDVTNKNVSLLNDAEKTNLGIDDQQYVRQTQAQANTRAHQNQAFASISDKLAQNRNDNLAIRLQESRSDFRLNNDNLIAYNGPDAVFYNPGTGQYTDHTGKVVQKVNSDGTSSTTTTTDPLSQQKADIARKNSLRKSYR